MANSFSKGSGFATHYDRPDRNSHFLTTCRSNDTLLPYRRGSKKQCCMSLFLKILSKLWLLLCCKLKCRIFLRLAVWPYLTKLPQLKQRKKISFLCWLLWLSQHDWMWVQLLFVRRNKVDLQV